MTDTKWTVENLRPTFKRAIHKDTFWLPLFEKAAEKYKLKLNVVLAVSSRETNIRNIIGDGGHGRGLMQIDDRFHQTFLRENNGGLTPSSNIDYGCQILSQNLKHFNGNYEQALCAYNAGIEKVDGCIKRKINPNKVTTGNDYGEDVLKRAEIFQQLLNEYYKQKK